VSKLRSDSTWAALSPEQRETLEEWLFEENIGYKEALERAQKEFGATGSIMSLARFYQRLATERMEREMAEVVETCERVQATKARVPQLKEAMMKLAGLRLVQLAVNSPEKVRKLESLTRLLVRNEALEIKRGWLEIGRGKFEYDIATEVLMRKMELDLIDADETLSDEQKLHKIREEIFGPNLPE
jgi:hypothetical protein